MPPFSGKTCDGKLVKNCKLSMLEAAPHGITLERAEEFNAAVLDFIAEPGAVRAA